MLSRSPYRRPVNFLVKRAFYGGFTALKVSMVVAFSVSLLTANSRISLTLFAWEENAIISDLKAFCRAMS